MSQKLVTKPSVFKFGSSIDEIQENIASVSDSMHVKTDEALQLPTAKNNQTQIDVYGYKYAGKKRKVELIFADGVLDIVWILTEAEEEKQFLDRFKKMYGDPTHLTSEVTFFLENGTAVRNQPHEVLFISDRLKEPYKHWLATAKQ